MKVGNKILKIRELKNITPKDMADRLNITVNGYQKIERDEVSVNMDRLMEIAGIFEMKPEEVLSFDERTVFNFINSQNSGNYNTYHQFPEEMKKLYEENARLHEERNRLQADMIQLLQEKIRSLEGK